MYNICLSFSEMRLCYPVDLENVVIQDLIRFINRRPITGAQALARPNAHVGRPLVVFDRRNCRC